MERIMKKTATFWEGVTIALIASIVGSIVYVALSSFLTEDLVIRLLISGLTIAYLLYLLARTKECVGRISVLFLWLIFIGALWVFPPPLSLFLIAHIFTVWLTRALYFCASLISALADLGLNAFSIAAAFWACHHTGSVFLSLWCFFLVQALFVCIPGGAKKSSPGNSTSAGHDAEFNRAYWAAEAAIRNLSTYD
jgi:hypothetical protein